MTAADVCDVMSSKKIGPWGRSLRDTSPARTSVVVNSSTTTRSTCGCNRSCSH
ncbi:MAG TPA: hypothetical protein VEK11_15755 [Thermoanaerobaculia bacterium]|nr:hypothetical protein [Thermoanaerobaculia bacterium]